MAEKLKTLKDWERQDKFRMESAVREIQKSPNLRFLILSILTATGATGTPTGDTPHTMALNVGRHSIGTDLIQTLSEYQPSLIGTLLLEDADETKERLTLAAKENENEPDY